MQCWVHDYCVGRIRIADFYPILCLSFSFSSWCSECDITNIMNSIVCMCLYICERGKHVCVPVWCIHSCIHITLQMLWTTDIKEFIRLSNSPVIILCLKVFTGQALSMPAYSGLGEAGCCLSSHQPCFSSRHWMLAGEISKAWLCCCVRSTVALLIHICCLRPALWLFLRLLILYNLYAWQTLCQVQTYRSRDNLQRTYVSLCSSYLFFMQLNYT